MSKALDVCHELMDFHCDLRVKRKLAELEDSILDLEHENEMQQEQITELKDKEILAAKYGA